MRTDLVCDAIDVEVRRCPHRRGDTIVHCGRGSQYTSQRLADDLEKYGIRPSTGCAGVCWAGAWAESSATLKNERAPPHGLPHAQEDSQRYCLLD